MLLSNRKTARLLPILILVILCLSFIALADDDEHESRLKDENLTSDQIALRDSVYGFINKAYTQRFKTLMQPCCYDCHSDQADYPWYHSIPGIGGMIDGHIEEAREHLDLSNDFPFAGYESQTKALEEIKEEIEEGEMPLLSYRMLHWGSTIDGDERDSLFAWADAAIGWEEYIYWRLFPAQVMAVHEAPDGAIIIDEHGRMWWHRVLVGWNPLAVPPARMSRVSDNGRTAPTTLRCVWACLFGFCPTRTSCQPTARSSVPRPERNEMKRRVGETGSHRKQCGTKAQEDGYLA